jgi:GT2 family glycosyltransferase
MFMGVIHKEVRRVLVAVVTFNNENDIVDCLQSVKAQMYDGLDVLVVDNASFDRTVALVRERYPEVRIVREKTNRGFAAGANSALRAAIKGGYDFTWLLNPDTNAENAALMALVSAADEYPRGALFSPLIRDGDGSVWFSGGRIDWQRQRAVHQTDNPVAPVTHPKNRFLTGCAIFVRMAALKEFGLFDERYFLYYEDADLSLRAVESGWDLGVVPQAIVHHMERSTTNPKKTYHLVRSGLLFFSKWRRKGCGRMYFLGYAILRGLKNRIEFLVFGGETARQVMYAHRDAWKAIRARI